MTTGGYKYYSKDALCSTAYIAKELLLLLRRKLQNTDHPRILDLGCGNGSLTLWVAQQGVADEVVGVDRSVSGIEIAERSSVSNCQFFNKSIYEITGDELGGPFDVIMAIEVIEHLPEVDSFFSIVKKCLKPGGSLVLSTPYHGYLKNLLIALLNKWDSHHTSTVDGYHLRFFSRESLSRLLERNHFKNIEWKGVGRLPLLWKSMIFSCDYGS